MLAYSGRGSSVTHLPVTGQGGCVSAALSSQKLAVDCRLGVVAALVAAPGLTVVVRRRSCCRQRSTYRIQCALISSVKCRPQRSVACHAEKEVLTIRIPDPEDFRQAAAAALPVDTTDLFAKVKSSADAARTLSLEVPHMEVESLTALVEGMPRQAANLFADPALSALALPSSLGVLLVWALAVRRGRLWWAEELPLRYDGAWIEAYWQKRPLRLFQRLIEVGIKAGTFSLLVELDKLTDKEDEMMPQRAVEARELITDLGPAFVKIVQVWASRPDILPEPYQKELEKLLERVRPFGRDEALQTLRRNITGDGKLEELFDDMSVFDKPVAAASIGQVYKASVQGRPVAVKVQRPDVREQVTLDLYVIRRLAGLGSLVPVERYARQFKSLFELIDRVAPPFIEELDYENEASNQRRFGESIANCDIIRDTVVVPEVLVSNREVLVQEWLAGKKLTEPGAAKEQADRVVKILGSAYMVQLLETGFLHGDPHPGNFVLTPSGKLGILDYGLMTEISPDKRVAFIEYIAHVQAKKYDECLVDLVNLEFFPPGLANDKEAREVIVPGLASTLEILFEQSDLRVQREKFKKQREELQESGKLEQLQETLRDIANKYGSFRLPAYATLIIRALATIEGVGLRASSQFSIIKECFPYVARRLLTDDSLRIREALRDYLYMGRQRIALKRVDDIATGFRTFTNLMKGSRAVAAKAGAPLPTEAESSDHEAPGSVDVATKDIAEVVFSPQGNFLQALLIDEGVAAVDALSRAAILQLIRALGPFSFPIAAPLGLLLGGDTSAAETRILAREDKEALLLLRRIFQLVQASDDDTASETLEEAVPASGNYIRGIVEDVQRLQPLVQGLIPSVAPGAASFARRFAQQLFSRAVLRLAQDIEGGVIGSSSRRTLA